MKICMIPDANVCCMHNAVGKLLTSHRLLQSKHRHLVLRVSNTISSIYAGRVDCQTKVRAARGPLQQVRADAYNLWVLVDFPSSEYYDTDLAYALCTLINHTEPMVLDNWEVS